MNYRKGLERRLRNAFFYIHKNIKLLDLVVFIYYAWLICNGQLSDFIPARNPMDYTALQTQGFANGSLHLALEPSRELLSLPDPYDPMQNQNFRLHDASLYNGHYYLYFSPLLAILFGLPFYFTSGGFFLPQKVLVVLFAFGIYLILKSIISSLIFSSSITKSETRKSVLLFSFAAAFATNICYVLTRIEIYETIIVAAMFFQLLSIWVLTRSFQRGDAPPFLVIGILCSISVTLRPNQIFSALVICLFSILVHRQNKKFHLSITVKAILSSLIPVFLSIVALLVYNYFRFDSILEFGKSYQLTGMDERGKGWFAPSNLPPQLFANFLNPVKRDLSFPFFHIEPRPPLGAFDNGVPGEHFMGVFALPISWLLLLMVFPTTWRCLTKYAKLSLILFLILGATNILLASFGPGTSSRYTLEFQFFYFLSQMVIASSTLRSNLEIRSNLPLHISILWSRLFLILLVSISAIIVFLSSLQGYSERLLNRSPDQYNFLKMLIFFPFQVASEKILGN